jgi:hypothetical protein
MYMNFKNITFVVLGFLFGASPVFALGAPNVTSFTANPQTINYGYSTLLSWAIDNSSGYSLYFTCPPTGVTIKRDTGVAFPCNTKQSVSTSSNDSAAFFVNNVTGNPVVVIAKIIPQDVSGADYNSGAATVNLYVGAVPNPITDFSYATTTATGQTYPITLSWTGVEVTGTNIQFECKDGVQVYSTNPTVSLPVACGKPAYVSDLPASGTASVYFVNSNQYPVDQVVRIFPAISASVYDATHSRSLTFSVPAKPPKAVASISSFSSPQTLIASGQNINLSWITSNTLGVNLKISCAQQLTWSSVTSTSTFPLLCDTPGFITALPPTGSTTVSFANGNTSSIGVTVSLLPQNYDGTYDGTNVSNISLRVLEPGHVEQARTAPGAPLVTPANTTTGTSVSASATGKTVLHTLIFSLNLRLGSRNAQVTALQNLLRQDSTLYPEGTVSGYMGPATKAALKRFQVRYGIAKPGDDGYGSVGPKTRAKLNSISTF